MELDFFYHRLTLRMTKSSETLAHESTSSKSTKSTSKGSVKSAGLVKRARTVERSRPIENSRRYKPVTPTSQETEITLSSSFDSMKLNSTKSKSWMDILRWKPRTDVSANYEIQSILSAQYSALRCLKSGQCQDYLKVRMYFCFYKASS